VLLLLLLLLLLRDCVVPPFFFFFSSVLSTLFCVNKVGMMTAAMSFASLQGDVVDHGGGGMIEISNRHGIPLTYYLRLLLLKFLL